MLKLDFYMSNLRLFNTCSELLMLGTKKIFLLWTVDKWSIFSKRKKYNDCVNVFNEKKFNYVISYKLIFIVDNQKWNIFDKVELNLVVVVGQILDTHCLFVY